jgi:hypothetical protein
LLGGVAAVYCYCYGISWHGMAWHGSVDRPIVISCSDQGRGFSFPFDLFALADSLLSCIHISLC